MLCIAMIPDGDYAIVIGWGASRMKIVKGQATRNMEDALQVLTVKGFIEIF
jgi:hypothetical protein